MTRHRILGYLVAGALAGGGVGPAGAAPARKPPPKPVVRIRTLRFVLKSSTSWHSPAAGSFQSCFMVLGDDSCAEFDTAKDEKFFTLTASDGDDPLDPTGTAIPVSLWPSQGAGVHSGKETFTCGPVSNQPISSRTTWRLSVDAVSADTDCPAAPGEGNPVTQRGTVTVVLKLSNLPIRR